MKRTLCVVLATSFVLIACGQEGDKSSASPPVGGANSDSAKKDSVRILLAVSRNNPVDMGDTVAPVGYREALTWHAIRFERLLALSDSADTAFTKAKGERNADLMAEADDLRLSAQQALVPYILAKEVADSARIRGARFAIKKKQPSGVSVAPTGRRVRTGQANLIPAALYADRSTDEQPTGDEWTGELCNPDGACTEVDPIVGVFLVVLQEIVDVFNDDAKREALLMHVAHRLKYPLGGPNSSLGKLRRSIIGSGNSEVQQILRDPGKRSVEIIKNWRDHVLPPSDGFGVKLMRNPGKCGAKALGLRKDC
jgi:hypothetical protein